MLSQQWKQAEHWPLRKRSLVSGCERVPRAEGSSRVLGDIYKGGMLPQATCSLGAAAVLDRVTRSFSYHQGARQPLLFICACICSAAF